MRPHRFRHASLVEWSVLGVIILVLAGVGLATRLNGGMPTGIPTRRLQLPRHRRLSPRQRRPQP